MSALESRPRQARMIPSFMAWLNVVSIHYERAKVQTQKIENIQLLFTVLNPTKSAWNSILFDVITYLFAGARSEMVNGNNLSLIKFLSDFFWTELSEARVTSAGSISRLWTFDTYGSRKETIPFLGPWSSGCKREIWIPRPEFDSHRVPDHGWRP